MRRGVTLLELLVAMGVLSVIMVATTRLIFMGDRAMAEATARAVHVGGAAELMADVGRDVRVATGLSASGGELVAGGTRYISDQSGTVRVAAGRQTDRYPGVSATFSVQGRMVTVDVKAGRARLRTMHWGRN